MQQVKVYFPTNVTARAQQLVCFLNRPLATLLLSWSPAFTSTRRNLTWSMIFIPVCAMFPKSITPYYSTAPCTISVSSKDVWRKPVHSASLLRCWLSIRPGTSSVQQLPHWLIDTRATTSSRSNPPSPEIDVFVAIHENVIQHTCLDIAHAIGGSSVCIVLIRHNLSKTHVKSQRPV